MIFPKNYFRFVFVSRRFRVDRVRPPEYVDLFVIRKHITKLQPTVNRTRV